MLEIRPYAKLGKATQDWRKSRHHFSFADYYDSKRINWGKLRVWNDDVIKPHSGFSPHPHRDMEIVTYVYQGAITHIDSMGNKGKTLAGNIQVMTAGSGIVHSEYNLEDHVTKLFQIWLIPDKKGCCPTWYNKKFTTFERQGRFNVLASGDETDTNALTIQSNARISAITLKAGQSIEHLVSNLKYIYLVATQGNFLINGCKAEAKDGVAVKDEERLNIQALTCSDIIMVETP